MSSQTESQLGSCNTLMEGTGMLGKHTEATQQADLNVDELIKASCQLV